MNRNTRRLGAGLVLVALLGAACGSDDDAPAATGAAAESGTGTESADHGGMAMAVTPASDLRAGMTSLLQEHVYLAGAAIATAVQAGGDLEAPAVASAVETLDANSVALSEAIGSIYGDDAAATFLEGWRAHIGFFVDYTLGGATGDTARQDAAKASLDAYRTDFGTFIQEATGGELQADAVAQELQVHVTSLVAAVDAVLAGSPDVYPRLREAASHMPMTAAALTGAIVTSQDLDGDPAAPASELRSGLTGLLQEHVYLAGLAINQAVADEGDLEAPATASAVSTLDANSVALSEAIGGVYGDDAAATFLTNWRAHIGFFVDYTLGGATGDAELQEAAATSLDNYRTDFGAFIDEATGGTLDAGTVADNLQVHVDTLIAAVDAVLAGSPDVFPNLREAAQHMPSTADALSAAIAEQFPERFPA